MGDGGVRLEEDGGLSMGFVSCRFGGGQSVAHFEGLPVGRFSLGEVLDGRARRLGHTEP